MTIWKNKQRGLLSFSRTFLLSCFFICFVQSPVHAVDVVLLLGGNITQYNQAAQGALSALHPGVTRKGPKSFFDYSVEQVVMSSDTNENDTLKVIMNLKPKVVLAIGSRALRLVSSLKNYPVVYALAPVADQLTPPPLVTGIRMLISPENILKRVKKALPAVQRIGVLFSPEHSGRIIQNAQKIAKEKGLQLITVPVDSAKQIPDSFPAFQAAVDAVWMIPDPVILNRQTIKAYLQYSVRYGIPLITFTESHLNLGATLAVFAPARSMGRQAGKMVLHILSGMSISNLPPEQPQSIKVLFNDIMLEKFNLPNNKSGGVQ